MIGKNPHGCSLICLECLRMVATSTHAERRLYEKRQSKGDHWQLIQQSLRLLYSWGRVELALDGSKPFLSDCPLILRAIQATIIVQVQDSRVLSTVEYQYSTRYCCSNNTVMGVVGSKGIIFWIVSNTSRYDSSTREPRAESCLAVHQIKVYRSFSSKKLEGFYRNDIKKFITMYHQVPYCSYLRLFLFFPNPSYYCTTIPRYGTARRTLPECSRQEKYYYCSTTTIVVYYGSTVKWNNK